MAAMVRMIKAELMVAAEVGGPLWLRQQKCFVRL